MSDPCLSLPIAAADKLIAAHDGDLALLYLYLLRRDGRLDAEEAAHVLCRTLREIEAAEEKLRRMGLPGSAPATLGASAQKPLLPADELPQITAEDVVRRKGEDTRLAQLFDEAEQIFGRKLSGAELRTLCGIYDHLALPAEVVYELMHYCSQIAAKKHIRLSMRMVEKEAFRWNDLELLSIEQAEAYIHAEDARRDALHRVLPVLGIQGREPSATERKYIYAWLSMGFGEEALAIAYDRTVTKTNKLSWPYMDKIILSWHKKGLHTPAEIEAGDGRSARVRGSRQSALLPGAQQEVDLQKLQDLIGKI